MASIMTLPFKGHGYDTFPSKRAASAPFLCKKSRFERLKAGELATRTPLIIKVLSETTNGAIASIISKPGIKKDEITAEKENRLADRWPDIHGRNNWFDMLDPMDPLLRSELIRYGEMAQACYDAFDNNPYSNNCGDCRYESPKFFESLGMANLGYNVTTYLYSTFNINLPKFFKLSQDRNVWNHNGNWMGYVAVSNDESTARIGRRDITISWRGTATKFEWVANLMNYLKPVSSGGIKSPNPSVEVEAGFLHVYTDTDENCPFCQLSPRDRIIKEVKGLIEKYWGEKLSITLTGHSLGSALAVLTAYDIKETLLKEMGNGGDVAVSVLSFAGPRVGNMKFKERVEGLGVKVLRVVNVHDFVPNVPGIIVNEQLPLFVHKITDWLPWGYSHVGVELELDHKKSSFLKQDYDLKNFHNLEAHLHLLDGYYGKSHKKGEYFELFSNRDHALVNKDSDFLKDPLVPPYWRQDENKGMVKNKEGRWKQKVKIKDHLSHIHQPLR